MTRCPVKDNGQVCKTIPDDWKCLRHGGDTCSPSVTSTSSDDGDHVYRRHKMHSECHDSLPRCGPCQAVFDDYQIFASLQQGYPELQQPTVSFDCFPLSPRLAEDEWKYSMALKLLHCGMQLREIDLAWFQGHRAQIEEGEAKKVPHYQQLGADESFSRLKHTINTRFKVCV